MHQLSLQFRLMLQRFSASSGNDFAMAVAILLFALAFLIVGFLRIVEFKDKGFSTVKRRLLIAFHLLGVIVASSAMALFGFDVDAAHTREIGVLVAVAFVILVPTHIYLALLRRLRLSR